MNTNQKQLLAGIIFNRAQSHVALYKVGGGERPIQFTQGGLVTKTRGACMTASVVGAEKTFIHPDVEMALKFSNFTGLDPLHWIRVAQEPGRKFFVTSVKDGFKFPARCRLVWRPLNSVVGPYRKLYNSAKLYLNPPDAPRFSVTLDE